MSFILRRLRQDHANLQRLLVMLERQMAVLDRTERPDWDIVEGVVEYLLTYPDLRHHPLEDQILRRLQAKDPSAAEPFLGLYAEHREQSEALRRIAAATRQVLQDASMARQGYIGLLGSFVAALRDHIRKEEESFFPAAEQILDATDWTEVDRQVADLIDPLSGDQVERRFAALRRNLESWDIADRWQGQTD
jgi:hemerythrin-like domain-containing protein